MLKKITVNEELCLDYYGDVMNSGHWGYFSNAADRGFTDFQSVVETLKLIGAKKQAKTLCKGIALWEKEQCLTVKNIDEDKKEELINKLQDEYYKLDEELDCEHSTNLFAELAERKL